MAEVQDEEQWLYGDADKEDGTPNEKEPISGEKTASKKNESSHLTEDKAEQPVQPTSHTEEEPDKAIEASVTNGEVIENSQQNEEGDKNLVKDGEQETEQLSEQNGEKDKENADDDSSSDDEPTVTIGKIVKQPDIMRPPPPTHRAAPTSGLKEEDFNTSGKINGIPVPDYNLAELEEKPWRKPGADLSDYFNYGFTEETWIKYCERQKTMRIKESGAGLSSLGITVGKSQMFGSSNIPVSIVNENSKYGGLRKPAGVPTSKSNEDDSIMNNSQSGGVNTIQVMTADRRTYSNKVLSGSGQGNYDEIETNVGSNPAASWFSPSFGGNHYGTDFFNTPPPTNFFTPPPAGPWSGVPNIPPPGWIPEGIGPPPPIPHHRGMGYFDEDLMGSHSTSRSSKDEREMEKIIRESLDSRDSRDRESRRHTTRRRSRSRSKSRHKRPRSKSRSRSPSHRHKRKKSKRERETE